MKLIITDKQDRTTRQEIWVTGVEINTLENKLIYVPKDNPNIIISRYLETDKYYQIEYK